MPKCMDCFNYKTRIVTKEKLSQDEFKSNLALQKRFANGYIEQPILYCSINRKPYLDDWNGRHKEPKCNRFEKY
jgi:hypothetical protein